MVIPCAVVVQTGAIILAAGVLTRICRCGSTSRGLPIRLILIACADRFRIIGQVRACCQARQLGSACCWHLRFSTPTDQVPLRRCWRAECGARQFLHRIESVIQILRSSSTHRLAASSAERVVAEGGEAGRTLLDLSQPVAYVPNIGARAIIGQTAIVVVDVVNTVMLRELVVGIEDRVTGGGLRQERFVQRAALADASSIGVIAIGDVANRGGAVGIADARSTDWHHHRYRSRRCRWPRSRSSGDWPCHSRK